MTNTQAPERIWALGEPQDTFGIWDTTEEGNGDVARIRLDLHTAALQQSHEDFEFAYARGFFAGQAELRRFGELVIIDSPELLLLRDALTQSRAETAAAYERAGTALDAVADEWSCGHPAMHCDCARDIEQWKMAADEVRAHIATPDQSAALAAIVAAAEARGREAGMREAAGIANRLLIRSSFGTHPQKTLVTYSDFVGASIIAAIPLKGETK